MDKEGILKIKPRGLFFWSDLHFNHKPILRPDFDNRPFKDLQHMEEELIKNYNSVVGSNDTCIFVGDVFFCGSTHAKSIMDQMNGIKILVTGNHDGSTEKMMNSGFDFVCEKLILKIADQEVLVSHYPYKYNKYLNWFNKNIRRIKMPRYMNRRPENKGGWLIHGHTHDTEKLNGKQIHVGCMSWNYKPVNLSVIEQIIKTGKIPK